jgi:hypothetical protein
MLGGKPVQYSAANVENFNSLQVVWSERPDTQLSTVRS